MSEIQQSTFLLNIFPVIILRWFPVKPQVLLMHTNSAIIYRHVRDHWDTRMLPFFLKYSTCFKDSRSGRRVHTYFSVHSSHHHLLNRHAANCIECTSNSSFFFFSPPSQLLARSSLASPVSEICPSITFRAFQILTVRSLKNKTKSKQY